MIMMIKLSTDGRYELTRHWKICFLLISCWRDSYCVYNRKKCNFWFFIYCGHVNLLYICRGALRMRFW